MFSSTRPRSTSACGGPLQALAEPTWVEASSRADTNEAGEDAASLDERGVHIFTYRPRAKPRRRELRELASAIEADTRGRVIRGRSPSTMGT